jgi:hypothetical protein
LVDPSHYERAHDSWNRPPNWFPIEDLLALSLDKDVKWSNWTYEMIAAVLGEHQERLTRISTTTLVAGCARAEVIKRSADYVGNIDDMYVPLRGTMVHRTLERYARGASIAEAQFFTTIDGIEVSCSPDLVDQRTLYDYKVPAAEKGVPSFGYPFRHQTEQLMLNAYIARHAERWRTFDDGVTVENGPLAFDPREHPARQVAIAYIGPGMPKIILYERTEEFTTARGKVKKAKRPYVWSDQETLDFVRPRLHLMQSALEVFPLWPEPWVDPDTGDEHTFEGTFGASPVEPWLVEAYLENTGMDPRWRCPGYPYCRLPGCVAARWPAGLTWEPTR